MKASRGNYLAGLLVGVLSCFTASLTWAQFPKQASFTTLITAPFPTEGLTGDKDGNLYTGGNSGTNCPIWRTNIDGSSPILNDGNIIGRIAGTCNPLGMALNKAGDVFVANGATGEIYTFVPNTVSPPNAAVFASGLPGANGIAFDKHGNLWVSDGVTGQGRVWKIAPCTTFPDTPCSVTEVFRIQPMANEVNLDLSGVGGVGRDVRDLPPGAITVLPLSRNAQNTLGSQPLVANGLAFSPSGDLFVADTSRGAIWRVDLDSRGNLKPDQTGCDDTFTMNTLCLDNIFVAHPYLEGADGIALDILANIYVAANERNAIVGVNRITREVKEIFRNPVNDARLRNSADSAEGNRHILEFDTSPFLLGHKFCVSSSDLNRRDNSPSTAGEIGGTNQDRGKISCMDQRLGIPGLPLPVR
jgi:sugar lactone lactonase YvrE